MTRMGVDVIQVLISLLLGGSIFLLVWSVFRFPVPAEPADHRRFPMAMGITPTPTLFERRSLAPLTQLALAIARRVNFAPLRGRIRSDLNASGNSNNYSVDEYIAVCLLCAAATGLACVLLAGVLMGEVNPIVMLVMTGVGFVVPVWTLHGAAQRRLRRISKQLPYTLDLIALMLSAGSTFPEAVEVLIRDDPNDDFNQELGLVQAEIGLGLPRSQALVNLARRIPLDALRSIVGAINQAEALGTPLASILKSQSAMLRTHRSVRAEKLSASASLRILIPTMLILVAVVLIIFGPMLIVYWQRGKVF